MTYRVILRARKDGSWRIVFVAGKDRLFTLPFKNEDQASWMAAKLVDELLLNKQQFVWDVQDEAGQSSGAVNLVHIAQKRKVRGTS